MSIVAILLLVPLAFLVRLVFRVPRVRQNRGEATARVSDAGTGQGPKPTQYQVHVQHIRYSRIKGPWAFKYLLAASPNHVW